MNIIKKIFIVLFLFGALYLTYEYTDIFNFIKKENTNTNNNVDNNGKDNEKPEEKKIEENLTSESNPNVIKDMFANGMSREEYTKVYNYESEKLKKEGSYIKQEYNFVTHLRHSELLNIYKKLNNSEIVNVYKIGASVDGKDIYSIEIGKGSKYIMLEGGVHASEIASTLYTTKFAVDLVNKFESGDDETISMLEDYKF